MTDSRRRIIEFIAGGVISKSNSASIYDFSSCKHTNLRGNLFEKNINVYDYDCACHINGNIHGKCISLYHFGDSCYINIETENSNTFNGYDFKTSSHLSGSVNNGTISVYDFQLSKHFNYQI